MESDSKKEKKQNQNKTDTTENQPKKRLRRRHLFILGFVFPVVCFILLNMGLELVSTSEYCGSKCHEMNISYQTWELSPHASNKHGFQAECIDCHLPPREKYFTHLTAKAYSGAKDMYKHKFGDEYDRQALRKKVLEHLSNETCINCHDNLISATGGTPSRNAHVSAVNDPEPPENRCVKCHEHVGHERKKKIFSP